MTHICVDDLTINGSDNGLLPGRCQAIINTNVGMLLIGPLGIIFNEILIKILTFSFEKIHVEVLSVKWLFVFLFSCFDKTGGLHINTNDTIQFLIRNYISLTLVVAVTLGV